MKKKILIFIDWFLPAYKAGGQIPSVGNIVKLLYEEVDFYIVTSDRDAGDLQAFENVETDKWLKKDNYQIIYLSPENQNKKQFEKILTKEKFDTIYFNSFFSWRFTILPLYISKKILPETKKILAPRGMLGEGALAIKSFKKKVFIQIAKLMKLYSGLKWHASSELEKKEIENVFGKNKIHIAPDISIFPAEKNIIKNKKKGVAKFVFFSRICKKKNLLHALLLLDKIENRNIDFDIIGPIEDENYWNECKNLFPKLSQKNIQVNYLGSIPNEVLKEKLKEYHFFFFPTLNENYGHVIAEALAAACPVILSDTTPWQNLEAEKAGWIIPLNDEKKWISAINKATDMEQEEFSIWTNSAVRFVRNKISEDGVFESNKKLFGSQAF